MNHWNTVIHYLADADFTNEQLPTFEVAILAGNSLPFIADQAAALLLKGKVKTLVLSGGVGHATQYLVENFAKIGWQPTAKTEAEMVAEYLQRFYPIADEQLILETSSTNSGENAAFSLALLQEKGLMPFELLLLQDPLLMRRTRATFQRQWREELTSFATYVPFQPSVTEPFELDTESRQWWSPAYFQQLVFGEMRRLQNNADGYGPLGQDFIDELEIPAEVLAAFQQLQQEFPEISR